MLNLNHCAEFFERVLKAATRAKKDLGLWPTILISILIFLFLALSGWAAHHIAIEIINLIGKIATAILCLQIFRTLKRYGPGFWREERQRT
jgi:hypothetical protein